MAHINTSGQHYALWLIGPQPPARLGQEQRQAVHRVGVLRQHLREPAQGLLLQGPGLGARPGGGPYRSADERHDLPQPVQRQRPVQRHCSNNADGYTSCTSTYTKPITVYRDLDTRNSVPHLRGRRVLVPGLYPVLPLALEQLELHHARDPEQPSTSQKCKFERSIRRPQRADTESRTSPPASTCRSPRFDDRASARHRAAPRLGSSGTSERSSWERSPTAPSSSRTTAAASASTTDTTRTETRPRRLQSPPPGGGGPGLLVRRTGLEAQAVRAVSAGIDHSISPKANRTSYIKNILAGAVVKDCAASAESAPPRDTPPGISLGGRHRGG